VIARGRTDPHAVRRLKFTEAVGPESMGIIAELSLSSPALFLAGASAAAPDVLVSVEQQSGKSELLFSATGGDLDAFERGLQEDPTIGDQRLVTAVDGRRIYVGTVALERPSISDLATTEGIVILDSAVVGGDWTLRLELPDRGSLSTVAAFCRRHGITMRTDRLYVEDPTSAPGAFGLTPAQREALLAAKAAGYFEDPRDVTLEELAGELDVSPTALGRRMRRGLSTLIERTLESDE